ncbi:hypothetical protein [Nonomuraea sp. SYSU D8015]|uniref:hypothetical protein n=1 Tax=Nonomuraea sp. SYSU D8015 TaxID=2593644 RepID=UPI0016617777|nr:hypothetical protein [Nonomuraea sp. SYSU D8015]
MADASSEIRIGRRRSGYTVLANDLLEDGIISARAYGILVYLVTRPDNWVCRVSDLMNRFVEGRDAIYTALKELVDAGYMAIENVYDETTKRPRKLYRMLCDNEGKFPVEPTQETAGQSRRPEKPDTGNPDPGNPGLSNYGVVPSTEGSKNTHSRSARAAKGSRSKDRLPNRESDSERDPAKALGLFPMTEVVPAPKDRLINPDTGLGLAHYFQKTMRASDDLAAKVGTVNLPALAKSLNGWKQAGVTPDQIRAMIDIYASDPSLHLRGRVAWVSFLARRAALAERLQAQEEADTHFNPAADGYAESWGLSQDDVTEYDTPKTWAELKAEREAANAAH